MSITRDIMNIRCEKPDLAGVTPPMAYMMGHRDARHAAAEISERTSPAHDLLEALEEMVGILASCTFETIRIRGQYVDRKEAVGRARAAIAKAKGCDT